VEVVWKSCPDFIKRDLENLFAVMELGHRSLPASEYQQEAQEFSETFTTSIVVD
jgi:hypothetical protein